MEKAVDMIDKTVIFYMSDKTMEKAPFSLYLTNSEEDKKTGMVCTDTGYEEVRPGDAYPQDSNAHPDLFKLTPKGRVLPEFQIIYISQGSGILRIERKAGQVKPGSVIFVLPGQRHFYEPSPETGWTEYWVGFNGSFFTSLMQKGIINKNHCYLEIGLHDYIIEMFESIFDEVSAQRPLYQIKTCSLIMGLVAELLVYERRKDQGDRYQKITEKAKYLMESNIYGAIDIAGISRQLNLSESRFNTIFRNYTAITPYQYFIHLKINRAKKMLEDSDILIKEVADNLGFEDQYYFSRLFKQKTGIAPSEWKDRRRGLHT
ncbi:MAG: AraC family transcriptional regulator [Treponema sp.]|jgi:AraC-like DNA-binding protein|nr:AraC family transcriptional regulator [Treponema sp.]